MIHSQNIINDPQLLKLLPMAQYEYVDITFTAANTETSIRHNLKVDSGDDIRWIDVTRGSVYSAGEQPVTVFRSGNPARKDWGSDYIFLMANVAGYTTRLLLFKERN